MKKIMLALSCVLIVFALTSCKNSGGGSTGASNAAGANFADAGDIPGDDGPIGGGGHSPEPATLAMIGSGLTALYFLRRRKRK